MKSALHKPENGTPPRMRYAAVGAAAVIVLLFALPAVLGWGGVSVRAGAGAAERAAAAAARAHARRARSRIHAGVPPSLTRLPPATLPSPPPSPRQHLRADTFPESFRLAVIADLDTASKRAGKESWFSLYMTGTLRRRGEAYELAWDAPAEVATAHNEAGRGAELSELVKFNDQLYAFDDRTGIMFQIMNVRGHARARARRARGGRARTARSRPPFPPPPARALRLGRRALPRAAAHFFRGPGQRGRQGAQD